MITLILSSCEEDFTLAKLHFTPSIVVNSVSDPVEDNLMVVNLSLSRETILENGSHNAFCTKMQSRRVMMDLRWPEFCLELCG